MKSGPRLPQLEKALAQKRRPNTAKNKNKNKNKKNVGVEHTAVSVTDSTVAPAAPPVLLLTLPRAARRSQSLLCHQRL